MASRLLSRSKTLTVARNNLLRPSSHAESIAAAAVSNILRRPLSSLGLLPPSVSISAPVHSPAVSSILNSPLENSKKVGGIEGEGVVDHDDHLKENKVTCFSPLEAVATKLPRSSIAYCITRA